MFHLPKKSAFALLLLSWLVASLLIDPQGAAKATANCDASVSPTEFPPSVTGDLDFTVNNWGSTNIVWVRITISDPYFSINSGSRSGWGATVNSPQQITFTGGSLGAGSSAIFTVNITSAEPNVPPVPMPVTTSDSGEGSDPYTCGGGPAVSITTDSEPPIISGATLTVSSSSVKISWTTNKKASSKILYGTTAGYGQEKSAGTLTTSHSLTLTGLSPDTSYHYKIQGTDLAGNTGESEDNTFTTAPAGPAPAVPTPPKAPTDPIPPTALVQTDLSQPFPSAPLIKGTVTDNNGVKKIEYSLDDGVNWLPVDTAKNLGKKSATFQFTPLNLEDGNYIIRIRAEDITGTVGISTSYTLVIDRLPPRAGGILLTTGPYSLEPDQNGVVTVLTGVEYRIILSAIGGSISVDLLANSQVFSLARNPDHGFWTGSLALAQPGVYPLTVRSIDGAGNRLEKPILTVLSLSPGRVTDGKDEISSARVELLVFDPLTQRFKPWDGGPWGQENPQRTRSDGAFSFLVPPGKYYLKVEAEDYQRIQTPIFTVSEISPLTDEVVLAKAWILNLGPLKIRLPRPWQGGRVITTPSPAEPTADFSHLLGKPLPVFHTRGKKTIVTVLNSWFPQSSAQIQALQTASENEQLGVLTVFPQESASKVSVFKKRGGYTLPLTADPYGELTEALGLHSFPIHLMVDRQGIIQKIETGFLSAPELLDNGRGL